MLSTALVLIGPMSAPSPFVFLPFRQSVSGLVCSDLSLLQSFNTISTCYDRYAELQMLNASPSLYYYSSFLNLRVLSVLYSS